MAEQMRGKKRDIERKKGRKETNVHRIRNLGRNRVRDREKESHKDRNGKRD